MYKTDIRKYKENADNLPEKPELLKIHKQWKIECISVDGIKLRAGHFPSKTHPPKANVLYLEGLADSMFNHDRLVNTLSEAGYRTIAFDYPGQGGSEGSMDQTRITKIKSKESFLTSVLNAFDGDHRTDKRFAEFKASLSKHKPGFLKKIFISEMADEVWKKIQIDDTIKSDEQINAVIGWSTGGLAAYYMAHKKKEGIEAVVLIAPGTNTKLVTKITTKTLNRNRDFKHVDKVRPDSPLEIPGFAINLLTTGRASQNWKVDHNVKGLVLLSDPDEDSYIDSEKVESTLRGNAAHFDFVNYKGAAHEIDNESDEHRTDTEGEKLENRVVKFLNTVFP
jgi:pimeloyl-ACP methyl ester carboxylesterase